MIKYNFYVMNNSENKFLVVHQHLGTRGLQWPVPGSDHSGSKILHQEIFSCGKGFFMPIEYQAANELPDEPERKSG